MEQVPVREGMRKGLDMRLSAKNLCKVLTKIGIDRHYTLHYLALFGIIMHKLVLTFTVDLLTFPCPGPADARVAVQVVRYSFIASGTGWGNVGTWLKIS